MGLSRYRKKNSKADLEAVMLNARENKIVQVMK